MLFQSAVIALIASISTRVSAEKRYYSTYDPDRTEIALAAATAVTNHITSNVQGTLFDRFVVIWLENTDYDKAYDNDDMQALLSQGIVLNNYWALSHPSQENYLGAVTGDYFALDDDRFVELPANVSSIVDLLESRNISWAEYQEHMPYTGFEGYLYRNQQNRANDYVRKHNPVSTLLSVSQDPDRMANVKNFTQFYVDLEQETLPQWMFITPNMTNDGHDSTIGVASNWARNFLTPLLANEYFMKNTLILLTFDENETHSIANKVYSLLLGDVIPENLKGTEDSTYYDHYSEISTVEANWRLPHLGRYDINANVFSPVAKTVGWKNRAVDTTGIFNNASYIGYFNDDTIPLPIPNCTLLNQLGNKILPQVSSVWGELWLSQSTSTQVPTYPSDPLCEELGKDINQFLASVENKIGLGWKISLLSPNGKDPNSFPVCSVIEQGIRTDISILHYYEELAKDALREIFRFENSNISNITNQTIPSASSISSANDANVVGAASGVIIGAILLLSQLY